MEKWNRAAQSFPLRGITRIFRHIDRCVSTFLFSKRARTTFQSTLAFLYRREVEKSLDSSRVRVLLAAKEFTHTEISRCHCPPLLITNSPCCTRFCFPLLPFPHVIRFFFHHSPPITLHTFPFPCPTNSLLISWFVRISHLRYTCSRINYVGWWAFC